MRTGWGWTANVSRAIGTRTGPARSGSGVAQGPAHAVPDDSDVALCGVSTVAHVERWPPAIGSRCRECSRLASEA